MTTPPSKNYLADIAKLFEDAETTPQTLNGLFGLGAATNNALFPPAGPGNYLKDVAPAPLDHRVDYGALNALLASDNPLAPADPFSLLSPLGRVFAAPPPPARTDPVGGANLVALLESYAGSPAGTMNSLLDTYRSRSSWNDRFEHWEKPASVSEAGTIERAENNVTRAINNNPWLAGQGVVIEGQGSYFNNTNVRREADIDLRAVFPALKAEYAAHVLSDIADQYYGITTLSLTYGDIFGAMRRELVTALGRAFGVANVDGSGKKAIRVSGITGSRAEVDVVPAIRYQQIHFTPGVGYYSFDGVAILGTDGNWTINYPERHARNGIDKRARTRHRFKRVVRILKRLRADMQERGLLEVSVPSFLVECLVYNVDDDHFLVEGDDRYSQVRRVVHRLRGMLLIEAESQQLVEINGVKPLFGTGQAWTHGDAAAFVNAAAAHLGDS